MRIMINQILNEMAQPRYFLGTLYLAWAGSMSGNIIWEAICVGIVCGFIDHGKDRLMK